MPGVFYPAETDPERIVYEGGWAPGPDSTGSENLVPTWIRSADHPTRSELLYCLCYPGSQIYGNQTNLSTCMTAQFVDVLIE
jgi:hypothetical protein